MAIYSVNHGSIGRSTHAAGTAGAHAKYILRENAVSMVLGENMPIKRQAAMNWLNQQEQAERKNGRMIDKVRLALPIELTPEQRADLVRKFARQFTVGRASWVAGIHDRGEDAHNPHAHLIIRDKDFETGKRVAALSEKGSTERIREAWELAANQALERAGHTERIDRRSLKDQGIDREPGIHVGQVSHAMQEKGTEPVSQAQEVKQRNGETRVIDWPEIDQGRTRADRQNEIEASNRQRESKRTPELEAAVIQEAVAKAHEPLEVLEHSIGVHQERQEPFPTSREPKPARKAAEPKRRLSRKVEDAKPKQRPAPRLFSRMYSAAAAITQRVAGKAAAVFERGSSRSRPIVVKPPAPPIPIDTRTPQQVTMDAIRANQAKERENRLKIPFEQMKAMLARDQPQHRDGPER